jgi:cytidylate kinase
MYDPADVRRALRYHIGSRLPDIGPHAHPREGDMQRGAIDVITISREFGAGGSELASALAERLGWPVLDHALVERVAERLRLDCRTVEQMDEHPPTLFARIASALLIAPVESPMLLDTTEIMSPDAVAEAATAAIHEAAADPPVIIVGHGAQLLLRDRPGTLHVRLVAPAESRIARVCRRGGCDQRTALADIHRFDDARVAYVRRYQHHDLRDPLLYDFVVNTGRVAVTDAAELIVSAVRASSGAGAEATVGEGAATR